MSVAVVASPLSAAFRERFEALAGDRPRYVALPELRRLSPVRMARAVRRLRGQLCYLPVEDQSGEALLPILGLVCAIGGAGSIVIVRGDLSREALPRGRAWRASADLVRASLRNVVAALRAARELSTLHAAARERGEIGTGRRVLYLNSNLWFGVKVGGSVGHVAGVVNALGRAGYPVDLWSATVPVMIQPPARTFPLRPLSAFGLPLELNFYAFGRQMVRQIRAAAGGDIAFIYQRMSVGNYAGVVLSRHLGVPLVLEHNGSEVWIARKWGRPLRFERLAADAEAVSLRHARLVVTVSRVLHDEIRARGVDADRVVWHPNGIDPEVFDPGRFDAASTAAIRARHELRPDDVVVTFVGTFGRWHGAEVLARTIADLVSHDRAWLASWRVRFLFVGDGVHLPDVRGALADPAAAQFVRFAGLVPQDAAAGYLAASDVLVAPHVPNADGTPFFGSPTKLFEYMAMGRAILASDLEQIGDVLRPALRAGGPPPAAGTDVDAVGVLATPGDERELAAGLRFLIEHPDWRVRLGANARSSALARYTWDHHTAAILDRLGLLIRGARPP